jgi:hypothetical protein
VAGSESKLHQNKSRGRCYDQSIWRFLPIFGEKNGVFLKTQFYHQLLAKTSSSLSKKTPIFLLKFSAKIFLKSLHRSQALENVSILNGLQNFTSTILRICTSAACYIISHICPQFSFYFHSSFFNSDSRKKYYFLLFFVTNQVQISCLISSSSELNGCGSCKKDQL